jgi:hypothetical protein
MFNFFKDKQPSSQDVKSNLATLKAKREGAVNELEDAERRFAVLENQRKALMVDILLGENANAQVREAELDAKSEAERRRIEKSKLAISAMDTVEPELQEKLKQAIARETLADFGKNSEELVASSAELGQLLAQVGPLIRKCSDQAQALNALAHGPTRGMSSCWGHWADAVYAAIAVHNNGVLQSLPQRYQVRRESLENAEDLGEAVKRGLMVDRERLEKGLES